MCENLNVRFYNWCDNYHHKLKEKYPCMFEGHIWLVGFFNELKKIKFKENKPFEYSLYIMNILKNETIKTIEGKLHNFNKRIR